MTEGQENNPVENRTKSVDELLRGNGVVEITNGFPANNGDEFKQLMIDLFLEKGGVARVPIIGTKKEGQMKVYALFTVKEKQEHATLVEKLGITEDDIEFATGLEDFPHDRPVIGVLRMEVNTKGGVFYQRMADRSDAFGKPVTGEYRDLLNEKVFRGIGRVV